MNDFATKERKDKGALRRGKRVWASNASRAWNALSCKFQILVVSSTATAFKCLLVVSLAGPSPVFQDFCLVLSRLYNVKARIA